MIRQIYFNFVNKGLEHWYYKDHRQRIEIIYNPENGKWSDGGYYYRSLWGMYNDRKKYIIALKYVLDNLGRDLCSEVVDIMVKLLILYWDG